MASSRLPPTALTLKQFMRRQQVLLLYRKILRAIRQVPSDADRKYLQDWAREEFKRNKSATEEAQSYRHKAPGAHGKMITLITNAHQGVNFHCSGCDYKVN
ncbi:LYR motif-containing protein 2 isoform X2 [Peromyscus californicus insignis]|uniref:LYR motif-containing protein 2 isoform X2 n=1 Tax=Peromyscus californicus insignis TaxID=564181 RepID=UPI0022A6CD2B|nr:LYR motif-containing protein 2 isoform X2 [Peromyscus californicus insignis]